MDHILFLSELAGDLPIIGQVGTAAAAVLRLVQAKQDADDNCSKCYESVSRLLPILRPLEKMPAANVNEAILRALREI